MEETLIIQTEWKMYNRKKRKKTASNHQNNPMFGISINGIEKATGDSFINYKSLSLFVRGKDSGRRADGSGHHDRTLWPGGTGSKLEVQVDM